MKQRRTDNEILADLEASIAAKRASMALKEAKDTPALAPLVAEIEALKKTKSSNKVALGSSGAQAFTNRRTVHELWLAAIDTAEAYAQAVDIGSQEQEKRLSSVLSDLTQSLIADEITHEEAAQQVAECLTDDDDGLSELLQAREEAHNERVAFSRSLRGESEETE